MGVAGKSHDQTQHTSRDENGANIPTVPDSVVYTIASEPPGINVAFSKELTISPTCIVEMHSAYVMKRLVETVQFECTIEVQ